MYCPFNLFDVEPTTGYHIKGQLFSCPEASELQRIQSSKKWKHITEQLNTKCLRLHKWPEHCSVNSNWWTSGYDNLPHKYEQSVWNSAQICRAEQFFDNVNETTIKLCIVSPWYTCTSALYEYFYLQHLCARLRLALMSSFELGGAQFVSLLNPTCLSNQLNHLSLFIIITQWTNNPYLKKKERVYK